MVSLVGAIPRVQAILGNPVIIGGLAVMCRLSGAQRVTQDLDTLRMRGEGEASGLTILRAAGAEAVDNVGGFLPTDLGSVRIDILEARQGDLDRTFTDPTDRLEAMAHHWALGTADLVRIVASSAHSASDAPADRAGVNTTEAFALVARPGPLVAMKLKASVDRGQAKEATDLLDIVRLVTDAAAAPQMERDFAEADPQLVADVIAHAERAFIDRARQTTRLIRGLGSPGMDAELIDVAGAVLLGLGEL